MGNKGLLGLSPAHRRGPNPPSPPPFQRATSGPDISWRSLVHRHKFLLYALGLLTFLCTIYLYFAITLGTRDLCSGLGGEQRALCQVGVKAREANHLCRLMFVEEDSDPSEVQNTKGFFTTISNLASGRRERSVEATTLSPRGTMEQYIGVFKATLDWVDQKQPKSIKIRDNPKASKESHHLRGNLF